MIHAGVNRNPFPGHSKKPSSRGEESIPALRYNFSEIYQNLLSYLLFKPVLIAGDSRIVFLLNRVSGS